MRNGNIVRMAVGTAAVLLVPLVAMQFTDEVSWGPLDFVAAGGLLFGTGLAFELVARRAATTSYRLAAGLALLTGLLLVWVNLAVGVIGDEGNPANLMFGGVLAIAAAGAALARLEARGMARALFATAVAQALVPVVAVTAWPGVPADGRELLGNTVFVALWAAAAGLFVRAGLRAAPERPSLS